MLNCGHYTTICKFTQVLCQTKEKAKMSHIYQCLIFAFYKKLDLIFIVSLLNLLSHLIPLQIAQDPLDHHLE